jgi:cysteine desulfurase/selenocysteine lyase
MNFDLDSCAADFPALFQSTPSGRPLVYLDSAATALRPKAVIDSIVETMTYRTGGVHRSVNFLGDRATELYENARIVTARWIGGLENEIVFTKNTTDGLNLIAKGWANDRRILVSSTDHHSSIFSWNPSRTTYVEPGKKRFVDEEAFEREISKGDVGIVCVSHVSNVTGGMLDVKRLARAAHQAGAILVLDAAQSAPHGPLQTEYLECDFLAFSGHKLGSPAGIGVLWGRGEHLQKLRPVFQGGGMIESVRDGHIRYKDEPWRLEAGTPALELAAGLAAAINYLHQYDPIEIADHLRALRNYAIEKLKGLPRIRLICDDSPDLIGPVSFLFEGLPSHVIARSMSDSYGVCVRSGYHCAEPLHRFLGVGPSLRLSFFVYNRISDVDSAVEALESIIKLNAS